MGWEEVVGKVLAVQVVAAAERCKERRLAVVQGMVGWMCADVKSWLAKVWDENDVVEIGMLNWMVH